jgi:hypothetical protein
MQDIAELSTIKQDRLKSEKLLKIFEKQSGNTINKLKIKKKLKIKNLELCTKFKNYKSFYN